MFGHVVLFFGWGLIHGLVFDFFKFFDKWCKKLIAFDSLLEFALTMLDLLFGLHQVVIGFLEFET